MLRPVATRPLLLVLVGCALAGCGDSGPSDEERIRATLTEFQRATDGKDYAALCGRILAPKLVDALEQIGLPCEQALAKGFEDVKEPRLSVGEVTVDGDTATAQVRSSAEGQPPSEDTVDLVKVGDGWRIASLGPGQGP
jgi:ketosteroid isomerase-like protein